MYPSRFFSNRRPIPFLFILLLISCKSKNDKGAHWQTINLSNGLYVELYKGLSQGAFGSDLVDGYLTDSLNFRVYTGRSDEYYDLVYYEPVGRDSILIQKSHKGDSISSVMKVVEEHTYSIGALVKLKNLSSPEILNIKDATAH
jgi:hypothetical protein